MEATITNQDSKLPLKPADAGILLLLAAVSVAGTVLYVQQENTLYWSDYLQHFWIWQQSVELIGLSPLAWIMWLLGADAERSPYYTVMNLPFGLLFGTGRLSFELSVLLTYAWPFLILSSLVVAKLFANRYSFRLVFWSALAAIGLNPLFWAVPLRGYPDYAAGCTLMLAWLIYLNDPTLSRRANLALMGVMFGLTPLLRRHYAYAVAAACAAMFAHSVAVRGRKNMARIILDFAIVALYAGGIAALIGSNYLNDVIHFNYDQVFKAFHLNAAFCLRYYAISFGAGWLLLCAAGWYLIVKEKMLSPGNGSLVAVYLLAIVALWFAAVEMVGLHYTAHFAWIFAIGLTALLVKLLSLRSTGSQCALLGMLAFLTLNLAQGLGIFIAGLPTTTRFEVYSQQTSGEPLGYVFSAANPPPVRGDMKEIGELCRYLKENFSGHSLLSVAASSSVFNDELLHYAFSKFIAPADQASMPQLVKLPQIDFRDDNPVHNLVQCDCFIVAEPPQFHLPPDRQRLLQFTIDSLIGRRGLAGDFSPMARQFHLDRGVTLTLYKRHDAAKLAQLSESIRVFAPYEKAPHYMFNPWLVWQGEDDVDTLFLTRARQHVPVIRLHKGVKRTHLQLIYLGVCLQPLRLSGSVNGSLSGSVKLIDPTSSAQTAVAAIHSDATHPFTVDIPEGGVATLLQVDADVQAAENTAEVIIQLPQPQPIVK